MLTIIEQSFEPGEMVSSTARRHGVAPNLLYRWRRLLSEGGAAAADSDEPVVGKSEVKKLEDRVRELEHMLGRKTMEVEILREALSKADSKNGYRGRSCCRRTVRAEPVPMRLVWPGSPDWVRPKQGRGSFKTNAILS